MRINLTISVATLLFALSACSSSKSSSPAATASNSNTPTTTIGTGTSTSSGGENTTTPRTGTSTSSGGENTTTPRTGTGASSGNGSNPFPKTIEEQNAQKISYTYIVPDGRTEGYQMPNDLVSNARSDVLNGVNFQNFKYVTDVAQISSTVTMKGYIGSAKTTDVGRFNLILGASTLNFDFSDPKNRTVTGTANGFGMYNFTTNATGEKALCAPTTCFYTKTSDLTGSMALTGNVNTIQNREQLTVTIGDGAILTETTGNKTIARDFSRVSMNGSFIHSAQDNTLMVATSAKGATNAPNIKVTTTENGVETSQEIQTDVFGRWRK